MSQECLKIGTRGSPLALRQAQLVADLVTNDAPELHIDILPMLTKGDQLKDQPLSLVGGKGLFCKEIDRALMDGLVDVAVHSAKDMPTELMPGLVIAAVLEREDPRDAFISPHAKHFVDLPRYATVGTASLRRQTQLKYYRPDLRIQLMRGNVGTRLEKLASGEVHGTLLAVAGLKRLGRTKAITSILPVTDMLPAVGQGALVLMCRSSDQKVLDLLAPLNHPETHTCLMAERALLRALDGNCNTPIGGYAQLIEGKIYLEGMLADPLKGFMRKDRRVGADPDQIGEELALSLKAMIRVK